MAAVEIRRSARAGPSQARREGGCRPGDRRGRLAGPGHTERAGADPGAVDKAMAKSRRPSASAAPGSSPGRFGNLDHVDVAQVAEPLGHVEAVADDEAVGDVEAPEVDLDVADAAAPLVQQGDEPEGTGGMGGEGVAPG